MRCLCLLLYAATAAFAASSTTSSSAPPAQSTPAVRCLQPRLSSNAIKAVDLVAFINGAKANACADPKLQQAQQGPLASTLFNSYNLSVTASAASTSGFKDRCSTAIDQIVMSCVANSGYLGGAITNPDMKLSLLDNIYPLDPILPGGSSSSSPTNTLRPGGNPPTSDSTRTPTSASNPTSIPASTSIPVSTSNPASITNPPATKTSGSISSTTRSTASSTTPAFTAVAASVNSADSAVAALKSSPNPQQDASHAKGLIDDAEKVAALAGLAYLASLLTSASTSVTGFIAGTVGIDAVTAAWGTATAELAKQQEEQNQSSKGHESTKEHSSPTSKESSKTSSSSSSMSSSPTSLSTVTQTELYSLPDPTAEAAYSSVAMLIWQGKIPNNHHIGTTNPTVSHSSTSTLSSPSSASTSKSMSISTTATPVTSKNTRSSISPTSSFVTGKSSSPAISSSNIESTTATPVTSKNTRSSISPTSSFVTRKSSSPAMSSSNIETSSTTPSTKAPSTSPVSSPNVPPARTVTADGKVCVLIAGSNDPMCTPESTPMPNPSGTNVHAKEGCISVNGSPRCAGGVPFDSFYNVASDPNQPYSSAKIYAGFDGNDPYSTSVKPGCELNARWPANYGDVYFQDNCLCDSSGSKIWDQCCTGPASESVQNPYRNPNPAASCERDNAIVYITFRVWIKDWVSDGGAAFHKEASGCGAMTGWYFGDSTDKKQDGSGKNIGTYEAQHYASFRLPITFKPECVMRAIKSAGGPEGVKC